MIEDIARLRTVREIPELWRKTVNILSYALMETSLGWVAQQVGDYVGDYRILFSVQQELPKFHSKVNQGTGTKLLLEAIAQLRTVREIPDLWQETANILGATLGVSRCLILDRPLSDRVSDRATVVAEYNSGGSFQSILGQKIPVAEDPNVSKAFSNLRPVVASPVVAKVVVKNFPGEQPLPGQPWLIMATSYDRQANGLIYLDRGDRSRNWTKAELEFVQQLAEQVGYYIAHLSMQQELQQELRSAQNKASQANRTVENFLQNISDKLRNPLNATIGSLNLVLDDLFDDPEEQREYIQDAHHSSLDLLHTINDLLRFSDLRGNQRSGELCQPVKLSKVLQQMERLTQPRSAHQKLYLDIVKPDSLEEIVLWANESRLIQVFLNVVGNGIKFTHSGGVTISCEVIPGKITANNQADPGWVEIRVCDTGIGVASECILRVFDPFFQVHDPRTSPYPGTGLGLSISKKLLELMGGTINFYSMGEGLGSTVIFTVPLYNIQ